MTKAQETEHKKLLASWARGTLKRAGMARCMVLSKMAEREAQDAFAQEFAARHAPQAGSAEGTP
jgi:hypothetical protein